MPTNIFNMTDSWNDSSVRFDAIRMSVANAASAADSRLIDLLLDGQSRFYVGVQASFNNGDFFTGNLLGNFAVIQGSVLGSQSIIIGPASSSVDSVINTIIHGKGGGGVQLFANGSLQAYAAGPAGTTRYIVLTGSVSGNPRVVAGGGGNVQIDNVFLGAIPTATAPPVGDDSDRVATTGFVKAQKYINAAPPTSFNQLLGFADPPDGTLVQGIDMPVAGLKKVGPNLVLADDLLALEDLSGTNTIYYRSGLSIWSAVVIGAGLTFSGGMLSATATGTAPADAEYITASAHGQLTAERVLTNTATITWDFSTPGQAKATSVAGGGNVSSSGTPVAGQYAKWTGATTIQGVAGGTVLSDIGAQPLDATLTAFSGLANAANQMAYFTGVDTMGVTNLTAFARTFLDDADAATVRTTLGAAPLDSPAFTGTPTTTAPALGDSSTRIATTAFVKGQGYQTSADLTAALAGYQPLDADLTSIAGYSGTGTWLYRSAANTWSAVTIGSGLSFAGGTLTATGGGAGDVTQAGDNNFTGTNTFAGGTVFGNGTAPIATGTYKVQLVNAPVGNQQYSNDSTGPTYNFFKSHTATVGGQGLVLTGDALGVLQFYGSDGSNMQPAGMIRAAVDGTAAAGNMPGRLEFWTRSGGAANAARMTLTSGGILLVGPNTSSPANVNSILQVDGAGGQNGRVHFGRWVADATGVQLGVRKSRGATPGTRATITSGDTLGELVFFGDDGTNWVNGAAIQAVTTAAPASGFVDTRISFLTYATGLGYTEKIRIYPSGGLATPATQADPGYGSIIANQYSVKQLGDNVGQGFSMINADSSANAYFFIAGSSNPNQPRSLVFVTNYPQTGVGFYNASDYTKPLATFLPAGAAILGTNTNDNALAGYIGEYLTPVTFNSVSVTAGSTMNVANISLTAGEWEVWGQGTAFVSGGSTVSGLGFNTVASTLPGALGSTTTHALNSAQNVASSGFYIRARMSLATTTTVYLVGNAGAIAVSYTGAIYARRMR